MILRQAVVSDTPGIWEVRYAVAENTLPRGRLSDEDVRREIEDTGRGWVVEDGGRIVAFAIGNAQTGNIWALFVLPSAQGLGHGDRLHSVMVEWLRAQNAPTLWLTTGATTKACGFYEGRGWRRVSVLESGEARYELPAAALVPGQTGTGLHAGK
jgi:GNAT superfamily N-acetyltransferase